MKIIHIGDLHFKSSNLDNIAYAWQQVVQQAISLKVDYCVIPGDIFDYYNIAGREKSFGSVFDAFAAPLSQLGKAGIRTIMLAGNHDCASLGDSSALVPFKYFDLVTVIERPQVLDFPDVKFACLPWLHPETKEQQEQILASLRKAPGETKPQVFLGHCDVAGAEEYRYSSVGGDFNLSAGEIEALGCDAYCLNHIHKRQYIGQLCYAGSLVQTRASEENNPTGVRLIEITKE